MLESNASGRQCHKSWFLVVFEPAIFLLKKLNVAKRVILVSIIFIATLALLTFNLYQQLNHNIQKIEQELTGVKLLPSLFKTVQLLQQYRGVSVGIMGGDQSLKSQQLVLKRKVSTIFILLNNHLSMNMKSKLQRMILQWDSIINQTNYSSRNKIFSKQTVIIKGVITLIHEVAERYQLINNYRIDVFYLVNTAINELSLTQEHLAQIRDIGTGVLAKKKVTEQELIKIQVLIIHFKNAMILLSDSLAKTNQYNSTINTQLRLVSQKLSRDAKHIFNIVQANIINKSFKVSSKDYFIQLTKVVDINYNLSYHVLFPTIESLITQERDDAQRTLHLNLIVICVILLLLFYFTIGTYILAYRNIKIISNSALAFSRGHFDSRVKLNSKSGLSDISHSFNIMAEKLTKLMRDEAESKTRIKSIIDSVQDALVQMNSKGEIIGWSHQAEKIFGWTHNEVIGEKLHTIIIPKQFREKHLQGLQHFLATGKRIIANTVVELVALHHNGLEFPIELTIVPIHVKHGFEFNGFIRDISKRTALEKSVRLASMVFDASHNGIVITDASGLIINVNAAFSTQTGYSFDEVVGRNPSFLSSGKQSPQFYNDMWQSLKEHGSWQGEVWNRNKKGDLYAELLSISVVTTTNSNSRQYLGIFTDITESKLQQEKLSLMAHYDVLTKLPNRALFVDRFNQAIVHTKRTKKILAVCYIDIDNFKKINDVYGHEIGDNLLIGVAKRIENNIRGDDTISRQGGDEFTLLLKDLESVGSCRNTLDKIYKAMSQPFLLDKTLCHITLSCGVTLYPEDNGDIDTLLRHADQAMYKAKQMGRNRYQLFNAQQNQQSINKHLQLKRIEQGLIENEFQMYYQPKVNMRTGKVLGAEALIRWIHPDKGLIAPLDFLPCIENTELEILVSHWVINEALKQQECWQQQNIKLEMSINVSSNHLLFDSFFSDLQNYLTKYPTINPSQLQLEILESSTLSEVSKINDIIERCQNVLGVKIALDDFGTGYSSLTHLRNLSADTIKIDRSFVHNMLEEPNDYIIVNSVIGLSDSFNKEVIAEGVETTAHGLMLLILGCEQAQGYKIAKPMAVSDFTQWYHEYIPNKEWLLCRAKTETVQKNKLMLYQLCHKKWKDHFMLNIEAAFDDKTKWPIMDPQRCSCGYWIERVKQEQVFDCQWLKSLECLHNKIHLLAYKLLVDHRAGEQDKVQNQLADLMSLFNEQDEILDNYE